jgi:hypothetical protein
MAERTRLLLRAIVSHALYEARVDPIVRADGHGWAAAVADALAASALPPPAREKWTVRWCGCPTLTLSWHTTPWEWETNDVMHLDTVERVYDEGVVREVQAHFSTGLFAYGHASRFIPTDPESVRDLLLELHRRAPRARERVHPLGGRRGRRHRRMADGTLLDPSGQLETLAVSIPLDRRAEPEVRLDGHALVPDLGVAALVFGTPAETGRRAATVVVDTIVRSCAHDPRGVSVRVLALEGARSASYGPARLVASIRLAHERILEEAPPRGTAALLALHARGGVLTLVEVNDDLSLYRVRGDRFEPLTTAPAASPPVRLLGSEGKLEVRVREERLVHGDVFVLARGDTDALKLAAVLSEDPECFERSFVACVTDPRNRGVRGLVSRWLGDDGGG